MNYEQRMISQAELRALPTDQDEQPSNQIEGYAVVFNQPSKDLGGFVEVIDPAALNGVDLSQVVMLDQHDYSKPLASVKNGTLKLDVDDKGLHFVATLDDSVSYAKDALANVKNGNVDSMSFRFDLDDGGDAFSKDENGQVTRTIKQLKDLFEISPVTVPAYDGTQVDTRSYNDFMERENKEKEQEPMPTKTIIDNQEKNEVRSFADFIRSRGEVRDGIETTGAAAVIPSEVITPVFQLKQSNANLAQYVTVKSVSNGSGHYPIAAKQTGVLATKEELAQIADADAKMFTDVPFDVQTRAAKIYLSNEVIDDSAVDIVSEVKNQLQKLVDNTDNKNIITLLTGKDFTSVKAANTDDLKKVYNVSLDPALDKMFVTNQSGFNYLDTLKDNEGRYLLQPNPAAASGFGLFGAPVVVVADSMLANNSDGSFPMIAGDLGQSIALFRRNQATAQWQQFDAYSQGLYVVVRNDYRVIDKTAAVNISLAAAGK